MSNPLIAVITCHRNLMAAASQRETWAKNTPTRFFYGVGNRPLLYADEVYLPAPDTYVGLSYKVQEAIRWALRNGFTHFFKCDDDIYLSSERLFKSGFENFSYGGKHMFHPMCGTHPYCHGGAGYWLDKQAMSIIADAPVDCISEDGWVANHLYKAGILPVDDFRYQYTRRVYKDPFPELPSQKNDLVAVAEFTPEEMGRVHRIVTRDPTEEMSAAEYLKYLKGK